MIGKPSREFPRVQPTDERGLRLRMAAIVGARTTPRNGIKL
jgi:hypothetical protein